MSRVRMEILAPKVANLRGGRIPVGPVSLLPFRKLEEGGEGELVLVPEDAGDLGYLQKGTKVIIHESREGGLHLALGTVVSDPSAPPVRVKLEKEEEIQRRQHRRFPVRLPVSYRFYGASSFAPGETLDLSLSGMLLRHRGELMPGQRIEALINLQGAGIWVQGKITRTERDISGVRFLEVNPASSLEAFLSTLEQREAKSS